MALQEILNREIINLDLKGTTKDEIIRELSNDLLKAGYISDLDQFVEDIYKREAEGITGMGDHIAIPHGKSKAVLINGIAIGRSDHEIEWESYDDQPINLVFLFCVSDNASFAQTHMMYLAELAGKLGNEEIVEKLRLANTEQQLIDALCR